MKNPALPKPKGEKNKKITLKGYFSMLREAETPLQSFVGEVSARCGVSEQTVRNWCLYGIKPQTYEHVKVLMELTGIKEEYLWSE